jgi:hypothetical protein
MIMDELIAKLKILLRAQKTLHKAEAQRSVNAIMLTALSIGCIFVALVFLNMGAFYQLTESAVASRAAFILAAANLCLAVVPQLIKRQAKPGPEEKMVEEIRDMALTEITRDVDGAVASVSSIGAGLKQLTSGGSPFSGGSLATLTPIIAFIIDFLKKHKP